jgi:hypothetical protein
MVLLHLGEIRFDLRVVRNQKEAKVKKEVRPIEVHAQVLQKRSPHPIWSMEAFLSLDKPQKLKQSDSAVRRVLALEFWHELGM